MEESCWINVSGQESGKKNHFIKEQGDKVIELLETAFTRADKPNLYIISPFNSVVSGVREHIKKYWWAHRDSVLFKKQNLVKMWMESNIGTVHKFQGKEASEVIFLLGCDTSSASLSAVRWVNNNIVNVAATRAKYRLYVIGDIKAWKESKCVSRAKEILDAFASGTGM